MDEAVAALKANNLRVVAYTGGLGRPDLSRAEAEKVYQVANAIGAPVLGVGLNPTNARLAYDLGKEYGVKIRAVVEVDLGMHRCGAQPGEPTVALAKEINRTRDDGG